jgi:hypothetical protein
MNRANMVSSLSLRLRLRGPAPPTLPVSRDCHPKKATSFMALTLAKRGPLSKGTTKTPQPTPTWIPVLREISRSSVIFCRP